MEQVTTAHFETQGRECEGKIRPKRIMGHQQMEWIGHEEEEDLIIKEEIEPLIVENGSEDTKKSRSQFV